MTPLMHYDFLRTRQHEINAEIEQNRLVRAARLHNQSLPPQRRIMWGLGQIALGVLVISLTLT